MYKYRTEYVPGAFQSAEKMMNGVCGSLNVDSFEPQWRVHSFSISRLGTYILFERN